MSKCMPIGLNPTTNWLWYSACPTSMHVTRSCQTVLMGKHSRTLKAHLTIVNDSVSVWRSFRLKLRMSMTSVKILVKETSNMDSSRYQPSFVPARSKHRWSGTLLSFYSLVMASNLMVNRWCCIMSSTIGTNSTSCSEPRLNFAHTQKYIRTPI